MVPSMELSPSVTAKMPPHWLLNQASRGTGCFPDPWLSPHQHTIAAFAEVSADLQIEEH